MAGTDPGSNFHLLRIRTILTSNSAEKVKGISITHGVSRDRGETGTAIIYGPSVHP